MGGGAGTCGPLFPWDSAATSLTRVARLAFVGVDEKLEVVAPGDLTGRVDRAERSEEAFFGTRGEVIATRFRANLFKLYDEG